MTGQDTELVRALVSLSEALDAINATARHEAESRSGLADVPPIEVAVLSHLLRHPARTLTECATAIDRPLPETRRAAQDLTERALVTTSSSEHDLLYSATAAGVTLRSAARSRAAQHLRYALAGMPVQDVAGLAAAAGSINALATSLGFRDVHPGYRQA